MATWGIHVFGAGRIARSDVGVIAMPDIWWPVIGCLLASPSQRTSRGRLAAQLWPEKDEASSRHCLANALWRIKARLPGGAGPVTLAGDGIALAMDRRVWIDSLVFERRAAIALANPTVLSNARERRRLARALTLYRDDFLGERDQEWIALERERLRSLYLDALYELAIAEAGAQDWAAARAAAGALCVVEPLREDAQRLLMTATARCGNRALALQLYRTYELLLARELAITPMPETVALITQIAGTAPPPPAAAKADYHGTLLRTRDQIASTLSMLDRALSD